MTKETKEERRRQWCLRLDNHDSYMTRTFRDPVTPAEAAEAILKEDAADCAEIDEVLDYCVEVWPPDDRESAIQFAGVVVVAAVVLDLQLHAHADPSVAP